MAADKNSNGKNLPKHWEHHGFAESRCARFVDMKLPHAERAQTAIAVDCDGDFLKEFWY